MSDEVRAAVGNGAPPIPHLGSAGRVLVVGAYGMGNIGDEAMLAGLLRRLRGRRVTVVSGDPAATRRLHRVKAVSARRASTELVRTDAVVIGGGSLFSSHMGLRGRLIPLFGLIACALGKPVVLAGISLDASTPRTHVPLVRMLVRRASFVGVRDQASARMLASWDVAPVVEPDLSSWLPAAAPSVGRELLRKARVDPCVPVVGLCLSSVEDGIAARLPGVVRDLAEAMPDTQFCVLPMSRHPVVKSHNDMFLAAQLLRNVPTLKVLTWEVDPAEMLSVFGALDAAICMRYHSLVFARRAETPIVAVPYAAKCLAWLDDNHLEATPLETGALVDRLRATLSGRRAAVKEFV